MQLDIAQPGGSSRHYMNWERAYTHVKGLTARHDQRDSGRGWTAWRNARIPAKSQKHYSPPQAQVSALRGTQFRTW